MKVVADLERSTYRPEIDGLRALAVTAVILYHADERTLPGGLSGVDVFFVLSGYLITGKILEDADRGAFSLASFWVRRLRRIVPALLSMLLATCLIASWALPPEPLSRFGKSLIFSVLPVYNFYLRYQDGGYFGPAADLDPLLHTWSLAVEEQFYLLFPLVLLTILRFRPRWLNAIFAAGFLASLGLAAILATYKPEVAFFYLPPRAWELMLGGAVALHERRYGRPQIVKAFADPLIWISSAGLLASFLLPGGRDTFPWPGALLPCFCTAALLALLRDGNAVSRVLAAKPLVTVGLISYSLYLWHQPTFALARVMSINAVSATGYLVLAGGIGLVSWASWRFVETPLRKPGSISDRQALAGMAIVAGILVTWGFALHLDNGWRSRTSREMLGLMDMAAAGKKQGGQCQSDIQANPKCANEAHWPPQIAILGDSHAHALSLGLTGLANQSGTGVITLWRAGCPPILGRTYGGKREHECIGFMNLASQKIATSPSIRKVILIARWARHVELSRFDNGEGGVESPTDFGAPRLDDAKLRQFQAGLRAMASQMQKAGKQVVVVGPVPEVGWDVPGFIWKSDRLGSASSPTTSYRKFFERQSRAISMIDGLASDINTRIVYPDKVFCKADTQRCITANGLRSYYYDDDHLSTFGAELIGRHFQEQLLH